MKYRMILLLLLIQVTVITKTTAQFFGVSGGATFTPLSTLDVRGTFGVNLFKDVSKTSTASAAASIILNSVIIYTGITGNGRTSLQIPAPGSIYLNRVYFIVNAPAPKGGKVWALENSVFFYNLFNVPTTNVKVGESVIIICNGTDWLQIN